MLFRSDWVRDAVAARVHANGGDDYGLGWWVSDDSYWALGRGGQHVKVYPAFNAIVVVTAAEFDFDQLEPLLYSASPNSIKQQLKLLIPEYTPHLD